MASLLDRINKDVNAALKAGDEVTVSTLRFLLAAIKNAQIEKRGELIEDEVLELVSKDFKRHKESIEAFEKGKRSDLVEKESKELKVLEKYLPLQMSDAEITKVVDEVVAKGASTASDMGKVMGQVLAKVRGKADGAKVAEIVKQRLTNQS